MRNRKLLGLVAGLAIGAAGVAGTVIKRDAAVESAGSSAPAADLSIRIDVSDRMLYVKRGGEVIESYQVAVGRPSYPTPRGSFAIRHIVWNPRWVPPDSKWARKKKPTGPGDPKNPMGRVKLFFSEPDFYIHGTRDVDSLGEAESHGCIRMRNGEAIQLAKMVMDSGGAPVEDGFVTRVLNRFRSTRSVRLSRAIPVTIT